MLEAVAYDFKRTLCLQHMVRLRRASLRSAHLHARTWQLVGIGRARVWVKDYALQPRRGHLRSRGWA